MASSMAVMTMPRSMAFSRATASAICRSSSRLALTAGIVRSPQVRRAGLTAASGFLSRGWSMIAVRSLIAGRLLITMVGGGLRGLAALERFRHQGIGEHQSRLRHVLDCEPHLGRLVRPGVLAPDHRGVAL